MQASGPEISHLQVNRAGAVSVDAGNLLLRRGVVARPCVLYVCVQGGGCMSFVSSSFHRSLLLAIKTRAGCNEVHGLAAHTQESETYPRINVGDFLFQNHVVGAGSHVCSSRLVNISTRTETTRATQHEDRFMQRPLKSRSTQRHTHASIGAY